METQVTIDEEDDMDFDDWTQVSRDRGQGRGKHNAKHEGCLGCLLARMIKEHEMKTLGN